MIEEVKKHKMTKTTIDIILLSIAFIFVFVLSIIASVQIIKRREVDKMANAINWNTEVLAMYLTGHEGHTFGTYMACQWTLDFALKKVDYIMYWSDYDYATEEVEVMESKYVLVANIELLDEMLNRIDIVSFSDSDEVIEYLIPVWDW